MSFIADLEQKPFRFDFFATLRRIERSFPNKPRIGDSSTRRDDFVTLGQDPFLDFPASSVSKADRLGGTRIRLFVKFLGMLGPQGALPLATTEECYSWWLARDDAYPRFLDILNNRFLQLFFRSWADARPIAQQDRPEADRFTTYIGATIGLGSPSLRNRDGIPDTAKLAFAGLIAPQAKSASRLKRFLSGLFGIQAEIEQFIGSRLVFDESERTRLGRKNATLGIDTLVGASVFSVQDKFRVRIVTRDLQQYRRFLPTGDRCKPLADAVFFVVGDELDWDLELALPASVIEPIRLGRSGEIGFTTWLQPRIAPSSQELRRDARFHPAERFRRARQRS